MESVRSRVSPRSDAIPLLIFGSGVALLGWSIVELIGLYASNSWVLSEPRYLMGYLTHVPASFGLLWGGKQLQQGEIPVTRYHRLIAMYWAGGGIGFLLFNLGLIAFFPQDSIWLTASWVRWALSLGLAVGLYIGLSQARTIAQSLAAERESMRAQNLQRQRDLVDNLNHILRHEVLNATEVITGTVTLLQQADSPIEPDDERLDRIAIHGEELTDIIRDVRSLLYAVGEERDLEPVDLSAMIETEVRKVRNRYPAVAVETDVPTAITVRADNLLGRVFANLLANAVEHNDTDDLHVRVATAVNDETAVVTVEDDGRGIPERERDELFDRPRHGDHGLGLYLVAELLDEYGGSVELQSADDDGTTFEVMLPHADYEEMND